MGRRAHFHNWDRLRVIGSLDIIGSHLTGSHTFAGVGLPIFLMISVALSVRAAETQHFGSFVAKRMRHVALPWLFWSIVIAAEFWLTTSQLAHSQNAALSPRPQLLWKPQMLLYGPEIHLWFLPFVAVAGIASAALQRSVHSQLPSAESTITWTAIALAVLTLALAPWLLHGWPFEQWAFSLPAVCLGFAIGRLLPNTTQSHATLRVTLPFAVGAALIYAALDPTAVYVKRHLGALLVLTCASQLPNWPDAITPRMTPLMLGIYMLHMPVYRWLVEPILRHGPQPLSPSVIVLTTFATTATVIALLRRTRFKAVL